MPLLPSVLLLVATPAFGEQWLDGQTELATNGTGSAAAYYLDATGTVERYSCSPAQGVDMTSQRWKASCPELHATLDDGREFRVRAEEPYHARWGVPSARVPLHGPRGCMALRAALHSAQLRLHSAMFRILCSHLPPGIIVGGELLLATAPARCAGDGAKVQCWVGGERLPPMPGADVATAQTEAERRGWAQHESATAEAEATAKANTRRLAINPKNLGNSTMVMLLCAWNDRPFADDEAGNAGVIDDWRSRIEYAIDYYVNGSCAKSPLACHFSLWVASTHGWWWQRQRLRLWWCIGPVAGGDDVVVGGGEGGAAPVVEVVAAPPPASMAPIFPQAGLTRARQVPRMAPCSGT